MLRRRRRASAVPIRGLGPNEVDLRGIILPARATSITSATVVGCMSTATPLSCWALRTVWSIRCV